MRKNSLTLRELNLMVREVIEIQMPEEYWVEAELSECREHGGHCYMELIEKDEHSNTPVARASAKCWRQTWMLVKSYFERITGEPLHAGMKVLLKVYAQFHEAYGFSWIVSDIDPTYTLGDMARKRQEIIRQLKEEGVFDLQRELSFPLFVQHIAVISAPSAAGYGDFCHQLEHNDDGFHFSITLFPAIMQGEQVEHSIISALNQIYERINDFDVVCILRGGGATADLSGFDTLALAENVAQFPLPIITGIGHERDESILDMVSHTRVKTPTAAAALLIERLKAVLNALNDAQDRITYNIQQKILYLQSQLLNLQSALPRIFTLTLTRQHASLDALNQRLSASVQKRIISEQARTDAFRQRIPMLAERRLTLEKHKIEMTEEKTRMLDPTLLLKRGYSITMKDGKVVKDAGKLRSGEEIETKLSQGIIKSIIK